MRHFIFFTLFAAAVSCLGQEHYSFRVLHRVNAHGDEFMGLAQTSDGRKLVVGTEKGELLIWDIAARRIIKRFDQGSPIHGVVALADPRHVVSAGGPHTGGRRFGTVRRWDIETGTFAEWKPGGDASITSLAADRKTGLVAAASAIGPIHVWDSDGKLIASRNTKQSIAAIALTGRSLLVTGIDLEAYQKATDPDERPSNSVLEISLDNADEAHRTIAAERPNSMWGKVTPAPDGTKLAIELTGPRGHVIAVVNRADGRELARSERNSSAEWTEDGRLMAFDSHVPVELLKFDPNGNVIRSKAMEGGKWHQSGAPSGLSGIAISSDGNAVWEVFRLGGALGQCTLSGKKCEVLHQVPAFPFAIDVIEGENGLVATAGDDDFIRVWRLRDFSLVSELHAPAPGEAVPQGVALMRSGGRVVFSVSGRESPTKIFSADTGSGMIQQLLEVPEPYVRVLPGSGGFLYHAGKQVILANAETGKTLRGFPLDAKAVLIATTPDGGWLAATDADGAAYYFEVKTGKRIAKTAEKFRAVTRVAVTSAGPTVFVTQDRAELVRWNPSDDSKKELTTIRGQASSLAASPDGTRVAVGGNHRDYGVYDSTSGEAVFYTVTADSDFHVTAVWISGDRVIATTDAGVLMSGILRK